MDSPAASCASFSLEATLNCGLNVTLADFRPPGLPDLINKSVGSTFFSKITFFTLCLRPLPSAGLLLRPRKSGPTDDPRKSLLRVKAPAFPLVREIPVLALKDAREPEDPNPLNFEAAGV